MHLISMTRSHVPVYTIGRTSPVEYDSFSRAEYTVVMNEGEYNLLLENPIEELLDKMLRLEEENLQLKFLAGDN